MHHGIRKSGAASALANRADAAKYTFSQRKANSSIFHLMQIHLQNNSWQYFSIFINSDGGLAGSELTLGFDFVFFFVFFSGNITITAGFTDQQSGWTATETQETSL